MMKNKKKIELIKTIVSEDSLKALNNLANEIKESLKANKIAEFRELPNIEFIKS